MLNKTPIPPMSSREFNQDVAKAKRAASLGPVTITDRGKPAFVLMRYEDFQKLSGKRETLFDLIGMPGPEHDFDFDPPRLSGDFGLRIPDFSDD